MKRCLTAVATLLALALPAAAAEPSLGEDARELTGTNWVMNKPKIQSIKKLKGKVIFIERWGVRCPPCVELIPHIEKLQQTFGKRGLHIFAIESQQHTAKQIIKKVKAAGGKSYPVSAGGGREYKGSGSIPVGWLIGVNGKVIWQGNPHAEQDALDEMIAKEIKKIRFPDLGRTTFHKAVRPAAKAYNKRALGKARKAAKKVLENDRYDAGAKADAKYVVDKVEDVIKRSWAHLEELKNEGDYLGAYGVLQWFASQFKKDPEGKKAKKLIKEFKKDKTIKKELDAARVLQKLLAKVSTRPTQRARAIKSFLKNKKYRGTAAAMRAEAMLK